MNLNNRITIDPAICHGKPTIRGLRYPVEMMMELFSSGMSIESFLMIMKIWSEKIYWQCLLRHPPFQSTH